MEECDTTQYFLDCLDEFEVDDNVIEFCKTNIHLVSKSFARLDWLVQCTYEWSISENERVIFSYDGSDDGSQPFYLRYVDSKGWGFVEEISYVNYGTIDEFQVSEDMAGILPLPTKDAIRVLGVMCIKSFSSMY